MEKIQLQDVFGISREIPKYTYVDRSGLDKKLGYLLKTQRHIVIHGASKQGKSCLRKKILTEDNSIIVQCQPLMTSTKDIWATAFRNLNVKMPSSHEISNKTLSGENKSGNLGSNFVILKGDYKEEGFNSNENNSTDNYISPSGYDEDLRFLAKNLIEKNKRLVIEDFHYLNEDIRRQVAFSLKALYELGVYVIIIGIWSEQNLLTYYNGDLTGRIEEINLVWFNPELEELLQRGENILNIKFSENIKKDMLDSSFENVGIFQRLSEQICQENGIYECQDKIFSICDLNILEKARAKIIKDVGQRYLKIFEVFSRGFKSETQLKIYYYIFKALATKLSDEKLIFGMPTSELLTEIQELSPNTIRQTDLTQALDRIERLQASRDITPLLVSYNRSLKSLSLTDREFLFYRKFSEESFDWNEEEQKSE
ncbi:Uncharacterised protein [uncultured archaeon]|nr:Uncharacterised protein [uncultured archaeon]